MSRPRIHALAAVVLAGAMLTAPAVSASGAEADRATNLKLVMIQSEPNHDPIVAATGAIHAQGIDKVTGENTDKFKFPDGNLDIKHKVKKSASTETFDPVTCLFTFTEKGTWKTIGGSGAYANAQGSGTYKLIGEGFGCEEDQAPDAFYVKITAKGNLTY